MGDIFIVGVGMTPFGKQPEKSFRQLTAAAVGQAVADAECSGADIEAVWFANVGQGVLEGQHAVRGQIALSAAGIEGIPIFNVENACASASTALSQAATWLRSGQGDIALAVGCEKMCVPDKQAIFDLFDGCWDVHNAQDNFAAVRDVGSVCVHGHLRRAGTRPYAALWKYAETDCTCRCQESLSLHLQSAVAVSAGYECGRSVGSAWCVMAPDIAHVFACQRWCCGCNPLYALCFVALQSQASGPGAGQCRCGRTQALD